MIATILAWLLRNWAAVAAGAAALVLIVAVEESRVDAAKAETANARADLADIRAAADRAAKDASENYRREEQRRAARQKEITDEADRKVAAAVADAASAASAAGRLSDRVAALVAAGRRAACNPAPAGQRAPAAGGDDAIGMLARVFERADGVAGELASALDRSRIAGLSCEAAYQALTP